MSDDRHTDDSGEPGDDADRAAADSGAPADDPDEPGDDTGESAGASADRGDPFDSFDDYRDREGDPFDSLGEDPDGDRSGGAGDDDPPADEDAAGREPAAGADPDPFEYVDDRDGGSERADSGAGGERGESEASGERGESGASGEPFDGESADDSFGERGEDPLADVAVSEGDPFESASSAFERSGVEGIDPDEVWDRLTAEPGADTGGEGGPPEGDEDDVVTVSKHGYCEGCEHFSPPPDVTCTHEGTDILAFVGVDEVRVSNCPVVEERRELEDDA
ncbi:hypothetical protein [Halosimplex halophilum]|uniref:hypothetical protein n=1 Tax=Halosimplex halophilum TaxID=2559572 RepID=UPI00107FD2F1|nr:hypothetical protein [Halosimplex halophilum]